MLNPTIEELTQGKYNRYELALATAKCARLVTDEYIRQHDAAERAITGNKETDRPLHSMIDKELRDEKAVKVAIARLYAGKYAINDPNAPEESAAEKESAGKKGKAKNGKAEKKAEEEAGEITEEKAEEKAEEAPAAEEGTEQK